MAKQALEFVDASFIDPREPDLSCQAAFQIRKWTVFQAHLRSLQALHADRPSQPPVFKGVPESALVRALELGEGRSHRR